MHEADVIENENGLLYIFIPLFPEHLMTNVVDTTDVETKFKLYYYPDINVKEA